MYCIREKEIKNGSVYFDAKAKVHLKEYIEKRKDNSEALFVTLDAPHDRLKISGVEIRLRQLGRQLKLDRIHPHKFQTERWQREQSIKECRSSRYKRF